MVKKQKQKTTHEDEEQIVVQPFTILPPEQSKRLRKKPWTEEEDNLLRKLVNKHGPQKWSFIAKLMDGRLGKQCRERWYNHLNPSILKSQWTEPQEWILFLAHTAYGSKWADMTRLLPHRTDNSIKNHWNSSMKKKIEYFMQTFKRFQGKKNKSYLRQIKCQMHLIKSEDQILSKMESEGIKIGGNKENLKNTEEQHQGTTNEVQDAFDKSHYTILQNRVPDQQFNSKLTAKNVNNDYLLNSFQKSQPSYEPQNENYEVLPFQTPSKDKQNYQIINSQSRQGLNQNRHINQHSNSAQLRNIQSPSLFLMKIQSKKYIA